MDVLTDFLNTAGQIEVVVWVLIIAFIVVTIVFIGAVTGLYIVRNSGADAKRGDEFTEKIFNEFKSFTISFTKSTMETQQKDRESFNKALDAFNQEARLNRQERQRDFEYRANVKGDIEAALKENAAAVSNFELVLNAVDKSQSKGLQSLMEVKAKMDAVVEAIEGYHQTVINSADAKSKESLETLERIERAVSRIDKHIDRLIESKVKESKPDGSTTKP